MEKGWRKPAFLLFFGYSVPGKIACSSSLQAEKRFCWGMIRQRVPLGPGPWMSAGWRRDHALNQIFEARSVARAEIAFGDGA
jgi:hypothetical protein